MKVYNLGDRGVRLTGTPVHGLEGELARAQNAAVRLSAAQHALSKRDGMHAFSTVAAAILAVYDAQAATAPVAPGGIPGPSGFAFGPGALDIMRAKAYLTAATTSINDNSETTITWTAESYDVGGLHDLVTDPDKFTCPTDGDGLLCVLAQVKWATSASTKKRSVRIYKNDTALQGQQDVGADDDGDGMRTQAMAIFPWVAGDTVCIKVEQDTGGALNIEGSDETETFVTLLRLLPTTTTSLPRAHAFLSAPVTLSHGVAKIIDLDGEVFDTHTMHDLVVNPSRITVPASHDGLYSVFAQVSMDEGMGIGASVLAEIVKNGATVLARTRLTGINASADPDVAVVFGGMFEMDATDYAELRLTYIDAPATTHDVLGGAFGIQITSLCMARIG